MALKLYYLEEMTAALPTAVMRTQVGIASRWKHNERERTKRELEIQNELDFTCTTFLSMHLDTMGFKVVKLGKDDRQLVLSSFQTKQQVSSASRWEQRSLLI